MTFGRGRDVAHITVAVSMCCLLLSSMDPNTARARLIHTVYKQTPHSRSLHFLSVCASHLPRVESTPSCRI